MSGKMKTVYGVYKKLGRDAFLEAATNYSDHVSDTVEATIAEMESHWYDERRYMTEADKMVQDYNDGQLNLTPVHSSDIGMTL